MCVDRCVCHDITFARLKQLADAGTLDAAQLRDMTGCGGGCGACVPYIHVMLLTGETSLPIMQAKDFRRILRNAKVAGSEGTPIAPLAGNG